MSNVTVSIDIDASPATVWAAVEPIEDHVDWMADAVAIHFEGEQRRGVGTTFLCDTKIGPIRLTDRMEITEWVPAVDAGKGEGDRDRGRGIDGAMGVRHSGLVTGSGVFSLEPVGSEGVRTRFTWTEQLDFPWFFGGRLGEIVAARLVLGPLWRRNLSGLKRLVEG
ncbi:MAG: SRPBCC family protein [Ilumatobacteraceae bacterium]